MTTRTLYHGSNDPELTEIRESHSGEVDFGGLFCGTREVAKSHCLRSVNVYECELDENDIADTAELRLWDEEIAALDLDASEEEIEAAVEDSDESWDCQILRGRIAKALGFKAVEMSDEHSTSWLVFPGTEIRRVD